MKKIITLVLLVMFVLAFAGCSETQKAIEEIVKMEDFDKSAKIEEVVIYDDNDVKITANKLTYEENSVNLSVTLENNKETDLSFLCGTMGYCVNSINGYAVCEGYLNEDIVAGDSVTKDITFPIDNLNAYGITKIADVIIGFQIQDADYNYFYTGPLQIKTSIADSYDYSTNTYREVIKSGAYENRFEYSLNNLDEKVLFDEGEVSIVSTAVLTNKDNDPILLVEMKSDSAEIVRFKIKDMYINGKSVYESMWSGNMIPSEKTFVESINLSKLAQKYEGNFDDVSTISEIKFTFSIENAFYNKAKIDYSKDITLKLSDIKVSAE